MRHAGLPSELRGEVVTVHVRSDRWYDLPARRARVWDAFADVGRYRSWWPWLVSFEAEALEAGGRWACAVSPPLPYVVHFVLELVEVRPEESVVAVVTGDIEGSAHLELHEPGPDGPGTGCRLRLVADLAPAHPALRVVAAAASPVVRRGHDWVLDVGASQFVRHALA